MPKGAPVYQPPEEKQRGVFRLVRSAAGKLCCAQAQGLANQIVLCFLLILQVRTIMLATNCCKICADSSVSPDVIDAMKGPE